MLIPLKLLRDKPLQQQLYDQLRDLILSSRLAHDTRMPSSRMLADQFSISRITVLLTYERLIAEGYLRTLPAKGTFVHRLQATAPPSRGLAVPEEEIAYRRVGRPDGRLFPAARWRTAIRTSLDNLAAKLSEDHPNCDNPVRQAVARWLSTSRGLAVSPDQVILTHNRQHALHIAEHIVLHPGARALLESPCERAAEALIGSNGVTITKVPVDEDGLQTSLLPEEAVALAYVTPEHQRPLGTVLSLQRRHDLLAWAARNGVTILEEDSDGELRYDTMDLPPLMSLDQNERVMFTGDFVASLGAGFMMAYLAVPKRLIEKARAAVRLTGAYNGRLEGDALASLLDSGGYARHLHQTRKTYRSRRDALIHALRMHFGEQARIGGTSAGLHLTWTLPPGMDDAPSVAEAARRLGLDAGSAGDRVVLLGFGSLTERQLETAVARLADTGARAFACGS